MPAYAPVFQGGCLRLPEPAGGDPFCRLQRDTGTHVCELQGKARPKVVSCNCLPSAAGTLGRRQVRQARRSVPGLRARRDAR